MSRWADDNDHGKMMMWCETKENGGDLKSKIVGEEDLACTIDESDAAGGAVCAFDLVSPLSKSSNSDDEEDVTRKEGNYVN